MHDFHNDLPLLLDRMKIEKVEKLEGNFYDKRKYITERWNVKQANVLLFKKNYKVIKLNQGAWLKSYIDNKYRSQKKTKMLQKNIFSSGWKILCFEKLLECDF